MPSILSKLLLFLSSYFPLSVILFFSFLQVNLLVAILFLATGLIGLCGMFLYLRLAQRLNPIERSVQSCKRRDSESLSYVLSYLVPFVVAPSDDWHKSVSLGIFFVVLCFVYVNTNMVHVNPMLTILGYRIYEVTLVDGSVHAVIAKNKIRKGDTIEVIEVDDDIMLEKRR